MAQANNVAYLLQQRMNKFIESRTIIDSEVNKFLKGLEQLDADVKVRLRVKDGVTTRDLLPSLWAEEFCMETYQQELASLKAYIAEVTAFADSLNQEALRCLQS